MIEVAPKLRIYIAGRYSRRAELLQVADLLRGEGVKVTSRWLEGRHDTAPPLLCASEDLQDIDDAAGVLSFTETEGAGYMSGGRHWEMGYAFAKGKWCWIVGPRENVFHSISRVQVYPTLAEWMRVMLHRPMRRAALSVAR